MAKYEKVGKGAAFTREKTNDRQPDFGGKVTLLEREFRISLWKSRTKKGDPYLSIQFSEEVPDDDQDQKSGPPTDDKSTSDTSGPWDSKSGGYK